MVPHIKMLDIFNNGVGYEVAIMKEDKNNGDIYFIRTDYLDEIDYNRLAQILRRRDAIRLPLWDLLSGITLGNGLNALEFFHQFVQVKTESGEIMKPNPKRMGINSKRVLDPANASKVAKAGRPSKEEKKRRQEAAKSEDQDDQSE